MPHPYLYISRTGHTFYNGYYAPNLTIHQPFEWEPVNNKSDSWIYWRPGQPDESRSGHVPDRCSFFWTTEPRMDDAYCTDNKPFFCKVNALDITGANNGQIYEWSAKRNYKFVTDAVILNTGHTISHCLSMCEMDSTCNSVTYHHGNKQCFLSTTTLYNATTSFDGAYDYFSIIREQEDCMSALVWPNYPMQVEVQASSVKAIDYDVMFANINDMLSIWWPYNDNSRAMQFLQVDFHAIAKVVKFVMLGGGDKKDCFVKKYRLLYTNDTRWWQVYSHQSGEHKIFDGNYDRFDTHTAYLIPAMVGRFIRIQSLEYHWSICFSFEMYGCFLAQEDRDHCSVVLRGSAYSDYEYYSSLELNGNPHVFKTTESNRRGLYLVPVNQEFCFVDAVEMFDLWGNSGAENPRMREFIGTLDNGTVLLGMTLDTAQHFDAASTTLFEELGIGLAASLMKQVYSSAFITTIGNHSLTHIEAAPNGKGVTMLQHILQNRKIPGRAPETIDLPKPLAHWPLNVKYQHQDVSGNNHHLQENDGQVPIIADETSYVPEYAIFDGSAFLRTQVDKFLTLDGDFSFFVAINPEKVGPIFEYHDSVDSNYQYYLHYMVYDNLYDIYLQSTTLDYYINLDWQVNHKAWNFITVTYHLATKRMSVWKNYQRIHSRILPGGFKPGDTARDYLSVGYSSPFFRSSSVINYKGKMACLQMYNATLLAGQIYRLMYECIGKEYMHKDLQASVSDILDEGPLGMMSGFIPDSQTKVSSTSPILDRYYKDSLRLYTNAANSHSTHIGCWHPVDHDSHYVHEWVEVDLGILHRVSAIVTVGCFPIYHLMTDFLLEYAGLDKNWTLLPSSDPAVNMTTAANFDYREVVKAELPQRVVARYVRLWIHTTYRSSLKFEVLGMPVELPSLSQEEIDDIELYTSGNSPQLIIYHPNDSLTECWAVVTNGDRDWYELDLKRLYTVTSMILGFESDSYLSTEVQFYKRFYNTDWDLWPQIPILKQMSNGTTTTYTFLLAPAINTRFLKLILGTFNASCIWMTIRGQKAPDCPPGSIYHENKCLYNHFKSNAEEKQTSPTIEFSCSHYNWATQGQAVQPKTSTLFHLLGSISSVLNVDHYKTGLTHTASRESAFWLDGTSANEISWMAGNPSSGVYGAVHQALFYTGSSSEDNEMRPYFCETTASGANPEAEALTLTITADSSLKLFVDGAYKGLRSSWNNPWILNIPYDTKVIAVEAMSSTSTPGLLAHLSNGQITDKTWKCTTTWYKDWTETNYDDSTWANATEIETYGASVGKLTNYGFNDVMHVPDWIWADNYPGTVNEPIYCRKTMTKANSISVSNSSCLERWSAWPYQCLPVDHGDVVEQVDAYTVIDCLSHCQHHDKMDCRSVSYYTDNTCILRTNDRTDTAKDAFTNNPQCFYFERWCSDCSDYVIQNEHPKGLVQMTASDEQTPATDGILNTFNSASSAYQYWSSATENTYQWIEASFTDYIKVTGITVASISSNTIESFYVFYTDAKTSLYMDIRDTSGNFRVFVGVSDPAGGHSVNQLKEPVITQVVRVNPQQWTSQIALSFDILGCILKDYDPLTDHVRSEFWSLGLESGEIGMAQLTASNTYNATYSPHQARFNKPANLPQNCGCWRPKTEPYLFTVDLLMPHTIKGLQFQSCPGVSHFVKLFSLRYSMDGYNWVQTLNNDTNEEKKYTGSYFDGDFVGYLSLDGELPTSRYVQFVIVEFVGDYPGLRLEVIGKPQDCPSLYTEITRLNGTSGLTNQETSKLVPKFRLSSTTESWCPDLNTLNTLEHPWVTVQLDSLYYLTAIEFLNTTAVNSLNIMFSSDGSDWRDYFDEQSNTSDVTVYQGSMFSFQRLQKGKVVKIILRSWVTDAQPCLQVLLHGCKAQACPPNSVQNEDICYYTDDITAGDYDHITDSCHQFDWVGPGYTVMPKDWLQFDFIEALVYPDQRHLKQYYLGLNMTDTNEYSWADNSTISDSTALPWSVPPSQHCTQIGSETQKVTSISCDAVLPIMCQVQASVSSQDSQLMWTHRWNVFLGSDDADALANTSLVNCMVLCHENNTCHSVVYSQEQRKCILRDFIAETLDVNVTEDVSWHYYQKYEKESCEINLMEDIDTSTSIQTSSSLDSQHSAEHVVYHTQFTADQSAYWQASDTDLTRPWINIDFGGYARIRRILTSGAETHWTTGISLLSSHNGQWFQHYSNNPQRPLDRILTHPHGLSDSLNAHTTLQHPFVTRSLQVTLETYVSKPVLRLAVFGCRLDDNFKQECFNAMGLSDGKVPPSHLAVSSALSDVSGNTWGPYNAGLDTTDQAENLAGWIPNPSTDTASSFFQVEFPVIYRVKYIVTQGVDLDYITSYDIHFRSEDFSWSDTRTDGSVLQYPGSLDKIIQQISPVLETSAIRIYPRGYQNQIALRLEIVGCSQDCPEVLDVVLQGDLQAPSMPCVYDTSANCFSVCKTTDIQATVEFSFSGVYAVTGFIVYSLNDTVENAVNLTENRILYRTLTSTGYILEEFVQAEAVDTNNVESLFWKWSLGHVQQMNGLQLNISFNHETSECVQIEVHGCKIRGCPVGFVQNRDQCYFFYDEPYSSDFAGRSVIDSQEICESMSFGDTGHLFHPESIEEDFFIQSLVASSSVYLGVTYSTDHKDWIARHDNSSLTYSNWDVTSNQPDIGQGHCVHSMAGYWQSGTCSQGYTLCQTKAIDFDNFEWITIPNVNVQNVTAMETVNDTYSVASCIWVCSEIKTCHSVEYNSDHHQCFIYNGTRYTLPMSLTSGTHIYFEKLYTDTCVRPLLDVLDFTITASSETLPHTADMAAINNQQVSGSFWQPATIDQNQWIQVTFTQEVTMHHLLIVGAAIKTTSAAVTKFRLQVTQDNILWYNITNELTHTEVFATYQNQYGLSQYIFTRPISGKSIKLFPLEWYDSIAMQLKLYGCLSAGGLNDCSNSSNPNIYIQELSTFKRLECFDDWNIMLAHHQGRNDFSKSWDDFKRGFQSNDTTEYYIGNSVLYYLVNKAPYSLRVDMWVNSSHYIYAEYERLSIRSEGEKYTMHIVDFIGGTGGNGSLSLHNGMEFLTYDTEDAGNNCSRTIGSGWWYLDPDQYPECFYSILTSPDIQWYLDSLGKKQNILKVITRLKADMSQVNIAVHSETHQSSTATYNTEASYAVDGYRNNDAAMSLCAVTQTEYNPYWIVRLHNSFYISAVSVLLVQGTPLEALSVKVGMLDDILHPNISSYDLCNTTLPSTDSFRVQCHTLIYGNIVAITPAVDSIISLNLCEVEVFSSSVQVGLEEPCTWDADCLVKFSQCLPRHIPDLNLNFTCQCQEGYLAEYGICKPNVDLAISLSIDYDTNVLVRGLTVPVELTVILENLDPRDVWQQNDAYHNFDMYISIMDGKSNLFSSSTIVENIVYTYKHGSADDGILGMDSIQQLIQPEIFFTPSQCQDVRYLCVQLQRSVNASYFERDTSNNELCLNVENITLCKPDVDVALSSVHYNDSELITRDVSGLHLLCISLNKLSGLYPIVVLDGSDVNYNMYYFLSDTVYTDGSMYINDNRLQVLNLDITDAQTPLNDTTLSICARVEIAMDYNICTQTNSICLLVMDDQTATYNESFYENNINCLDITNYKICKPEIQLEVLDITTPNDIYFIRGYNQTSAIDIRFMNNNTAIPIALVEDPWFNFNIEIMFSVEPYDISGTTGFTSPVETSFTLIQLQQTLAPQAQLTLSTDLRVLVPRISCEELTYLCANITPGPGASFASTSGLSYIKCVNVTSNLNCKGLPVLNATFNVSPEVQLLRNPVTFNITWDQGTDVNFNLSLDDSSTDIEWNWETAGHISHFGHKDFTTAYTYPKIGNYTTTLKIWNSIREEFFVTSVTIEPDLNEYINVSVDYTPNAVPVTVVYQFHHMFSHIDVAVSMLCNISYGDSVTEVINIKVENIYNVTYTFTEDVPDVTTKITCKNHVSKLYYTTLIVLRQEILGLKIIPHKLAFATGAVASFKADMESGTHSTLSIDFGDGTKANFTETNIYSYNFTWEVSHNYTSHGNYSIMAQGLNEHFSSFSFVNITIQNPVMPFDINGVSDIKVPNGIVEFTLIPHISSLLPDHVYCSWDLDHMTQEISYSTALISGLPDTKEYTYRRNQVGPQFRVNVTCSNLASSQSAFMDVQVFEALRNLEVSVSTSVNKIEENITFDMSVSNGSHVEFIITYDDGLTYRFDDPLLFSEGTSFIHSYKNIGNYSVNVTAQNQVGQVSAPYPVDIIIQNEITNLTLLANNSVLWPPGAIDFTISSGVDQKLLTDTHCVWKSGDYFNHYTYTERITPMDTLDFQHSFPRASIGIANITVNCSNLISWSDMNTSVIIILDEVIVESVITEWVWWTNTSNFNLTIQRFGTHSCFLWDMGDNTRYVYGRPWCATNASDAGLELNIIDHGIMNLYVNHTYDTWDRYTVSVFAFNYVSEDAVSTIAVVKDWYCYVPNITFSDNFTDPQDPVKFMKSTEFTILPVTIEIDCMKSLNRSETVLNIYNINNKQSAVLSIANVTSFNHSVRQLSYGEYIVSFNVIMLGVPSVFRTEEAYFEVIKTPLDISIKGGANVSINFNRELVLDALTVSFDHDVEPTVDQGLQFEWSCRQKEEDLPIDSEGHIQPSGPPNPGQTSFEMFSGCFGGGPGKMNSILGNLSINTGNMMPNKDYIFRLMATKDTRLGIAEQTITIIPPEAPKITVVCIENCESKTALSKEMKVKALCSKHCETKFGAAEFKWTLSRWNDTTGRPTEYGNLEYITAGVSSAIFRINAWSLVGGVVHTLLVESWTPGSYHSVTSYQFLTNVLPFGGSCMVEPVEGIAAQTFFTFDCFGWEEWQVKGVKAGLKYEYRVRSYGATRSYLVYYGNQGLSSLSMLPMGNYETSFLNEMELYIVDSVGDYYLQLQNVTVNPIPVSKTEVTSGILNDLTNPDSNFTQSFQSGDYQAVSSSVYSMTSLLNLPIDFDLGGNITDDLSEVLALRRTARSSLIGIMSSVPVTTLDALEQTNEVFRVVLLREQEVTLNSQEQSLGKVSNMTSFFVETRENVTKEMKNQLATDLVSSTLRLVTAADFVLQESEKSVDVFVNYTTTVNPMVTETENNTRNRTGEVMRQCVGVIDILTHTLLSDKVLGDPEDVIALDQITVITAKDTGMNLVNASFTNKYGSVRLDDDVGNLLQDSSLPCIDRTIMFSLINPFIWDISSSQVNSPVIDFVLSECETDNVIVSNRRRRQTQGNSGQSSFTVEMPVSPSEEAIFVNETITDVHGMIYHYFNLTSPRQPVVVSVYPQVNQSLTVYVSLDTKPTPTEYYTYYQVPKDDTDSYEEKHLLMLPAEDIENASVVQIGVMKNGCQQGKTCQESEPSGSSRVQYWYRFTMIQCQYWDDELEVWSSKGCRVEKGSTPIKVKFKSNLFGSLGAGVFVGPNTIDFGSVFDDLDKKIAENAAVVGTVIGVILLYIPLAVICWHFDKKDRQKWLILPLVDNNPEDEHRYEIHVYTGLNSSAGTESRVSMVLAGTESDTGIRVLQDGKRKNFQRGEVSSFLLRTSAPLGVPITLKIWHDNSGEDSKAGWFLSKVVVVDLQNLNWYLFSCDKWLSADEDDAQIVRILHLAGTDELAENEGFLLQNNIKKKLFDDHIWLSVGYRKTRSTFTRVQRLSCCLSILFLTMVSNAMWFGTGSSENNQTALVIGPISVTVHQLYTSVMSSLIIVPPVLIITFLFAKTQNSDQKTSELVQAKEHKRSCSKRRFPHWVIYIAYTLIVLSVACGAFFTILYAFEWGKQKSTEWLVTFMLSFFQSVVLIQPLKVVILAALITFLFKKDIDTSDFEDNIGEKVTRPDGLKPINLDAVSSHCILSEEQINAAKMRKANDRKLQAMIRDIVWQILYLIILLWVVIGNQDTNVYYQNQDLRNRFASDVEDITTREELWSWIKETLIPGLYYNTDYNGNPSLVYDGRFIGNMYGMRLGPPRLRQLRVMQETCTVPHIIQKTVSRCTHQFSEMHQSKQNLQPVNITIETSDTDRINNAFIYQTAEDLKGVHHWGKFQWYPSGGYVANLGKDQVDAMEIVEILEKSNWIDEHTRVVFVEFNIWNANSNLFNMFILSLEMLPSGGVFHWLTIDSINLYRYSGPGGLINLLTEICLTIFTFVLTVKHIIDVFKGKKSCTSFWIFLKLSCLALFYMALGIYIWRSVLTSASVEEMMNNKGKSINFQLLSLSNTIFFNLMSIMTFLMILCLLSILRYNRTISIMALTIKRSSGELLSMTIAFGIFFMAFCILCYDTFGSSLEEYSSIQATMSSLSEAFLGKFDFNHVTSAKGKFGGFVLIAYLLVMMLIIMNFFISLLNEFLAAVQDDPESMPKDHEVVDYCMEVLSKMFSTKKTKKDQEQEDSSEESGKNTPDTYRSTVPQISDDNKLSDIKLKQRLSMVRKVVESMNEDPSTAVLGSFLEDFTKRYALDIDSIKQQKESNKDHCEDVNETKAEDLEQIEMEEEVDMMNDITLIATANYRFQHAS